MSSSCWGLLFYHNKNRLDFLLKHAHVKRIKFHLAIKFLQAALQGSSWFFLRPTSAKNFQNLNLQWLETRLVWELALVFAWIALFWELTEHVWLAGFSIFKYFTWFLDCFFPSDSWHDLFVFKQRLILSGFSFPSVALFFTNWLFP